MANVPIRIFKHYRTHKWGNNPTNDEYESTNLFVFTNHYGKSVQDVIKLQKEFGISEDNLDDIQVNFFGGDRKKYIMYLQLTLTDSLLKKYPNILDGFEKVEIVEPNLI